MRAVWEYDSMNAHRIHFFPGKQAFYTIHTDPKSIPDSPPIVPERPAELAKTGRDQAAAVDPKADRENPTRPLDASKKKSPDLDRIRSVLFRSSR